MFLKPIDIRQVISIANGQGSIGIRGGYVSSARESIQRLAFLALPNNRELLHIVRPSIAIQARSKQRRHEAWVHVHEYAFLPGTRSAHEHIGPWQLKESQ